MLHLACIARNMDAVTFLLSSGINTKHTDKLGRIAEQVCFCSKTKRLLTIRAATPMKRPATPASLQDKDTLFDLVERSKSYDEIQIKLQSLEFDINQERNAGGETLLHCAVRVGISQLGLILSLVHIQYADVEEYTRFGMTSLCIAAQCGYSVIAEVLICCLGANPNNTNPRNKWTPLHYAARENKLDVVNVLIKRGADVNLESSDCLRPDDIARRYRHEDCEDAIVTKRMQRCELLSNRAENVLLKEQDIRETDLFVVDSEDRTLLMVSAEYNRIDNLKILLKQQKCPINAQHPRTGQTALSIASKCGNTRAVQVLMQHNADPSIKDIQGYLPIHYAVEEQFEDVVQTILFHNQGLTGLQEALQLCQNSNITDFIKKAMLKRQKQIVTPTLFETAANGNANRLYCVLEEGDNVNPITGAGDWPLMVAAENGHLHIIELLYEKGGDVSRRHPATNATALHVASARGHYPVVKFLLQICKKDVLPGPDKESMSFYQELDINAMNNSGQTAVQMAARKGFSKVVKALLLRGASSAILDANGHLYKCSDFEGVQVLLETHRKERAMRIMALIRDRKGMVRLKKVWQPIFDHNLRDFKGDTPLMVACYHGRVQAVKFLVESAIHKQVEDINTDSRWNHDSDNDSGTFVEQNSYMNMIQSRDMGTRTEPSSASEQSDTESTYMFNQRRCKTPSAGFLHSGDFTSSGNFNTANWFIVRPGSLLRQSPLPRPLTPVSSDNEDVAAALKRVINHLADYNFRDGCTCFHRAMECSNESHTVEVIHLLLQKDKSCINMQDFSGFTPLHYACMQGKKHIVKFMTELDYVDLNVRSLDGKLPEEMTQHKSIQKLIHNARELQPYTPLPSLPTPPASSVGGGSIDIDKLNFRFQELFRSQDT
ncbi:uncharacterized protein LOC144450849 [Glandiceps talaboti]